MLREETWRAGSVEAVPATRACGPQLGRSNCSRGPYGQASLSLGGPSRHSEWDPCLPGTQHSLGVVDTRIRSPVRECPVPAMGIGYVAYVVPGIMARMPARSTRYARESRSKARCPGPTSHLYTTGPFQRVRYGQVQPVGTSRSDRATASWRASRVRIHVRQMARHTGRMVEDTDPETSSVTAPHETRPQSARHSFV